ncbi:SdrD B-like domain-containing protein [Nocardioides nitrophenolicus]|uniref:SdrD B-like domain-containing protein n=1 Tax=Nocardioides nitrophenolicus TaxID=60489 RepID=UPI001959F356|nr:SdrD B-like domain-containing protein [Nocardioides nitrophenolicus]MBM7516975.1 hypothetical protein [Nocardioides nitrophenolicus]
MTSGPSGRALLPRRAVARLTALAAVAAGAVTFTATGPVAAPAQAASTDDALTVRVIRDMGGNGQYDPVIDLPFAGATVTVTDAFGATANLVTDANGIATLPAGDTRLTGGKYRVDVANPDPTRFEPAVASFDDPADTPSATRLSSNQEFVDLTDGDVAVTTGFWRPRDYCQSNPQVANACQPGMFNHADSDSVDTSPRDTLFLKNYTSVSYEDIAQSETTSEAGTGTGTVYGIAYDRIRKNVFSAAYAKRNGAYGPLGAGGIYVTDPATGTTKAFATVPNAGTTPHDFTTVADGGDEDAAFAAVVGKESLGAIVMSDDYSKLFVVNMADKKVYVYDATDTSGAAVALTSFPIPQPTPACATADDWRPMGLGEDEGTLYVGGVCSGETEATAANPRPDSMRAVVLTFDEDTYALTGQPINKQLNTYTRAGDGYHCMGNAGWYAWNTQLWCGGNGQSAVSTPMLGKIVVEANGDLDLAFRDRNGDMGGVNLERELVGGAAVYPYTQVGGGLNKACLEGGNYVLDVDGGCGVAVTTPNASWFYDTTVIHPNGTFAGMTMSRAEVGLIIDEMDGGGAINTQAITVKNRGTGDTVHGQTIGEASGFGTNYGKGQGLADMDVLCDLAPIQIGNRVWYNDAATGDQQPGELPVVGATVNLYDEQGNLVATTTTNDKGEYYFDSRDVEGLTYNSKYVIKMDNPDDYEPGAPLDPAVWQLTKSGTDEGDSKATLVGGFPTVPVTTGDPGQNDHSFDIGFTPIPKIHVVKYDGRLAGPPGGALSHANNQASPTVYQAGSDGMTGPQPVKMIVTNNGSAALGNVVVSDQTLGQPAMTGLTCDFSALGGPATGTTWGGIFEPGDSFPCVGSVNLEAGQDHGDEIKVVADQFNPITGLKVEGAAPVTDADRYYATTGYHPEIVITKRDKKTGTEADTKKTAMTFKPGKTRKIEMPATNVGTAPVHDVTVSDKTLKGADITDFKCTFPDGTTAKANKKGVVTWKASFGANPKTWKPGVTFYCTAKLTLKANAPLHADKITIKGVGPKGEKLKDKDKFHAKTGAVAGTPATGARQLPETVQQ